MNPVQSQQPKFASVELHWLPLGAGDTSACVRWNGRIFEATAARSQHRQAWDLYHSALTVQLDGDRFVVEMAPAWGNKAPDRGVVREGAIGLPWLGRSRFFRYEIRRWRNGAIPDIAEAVASSQRVRTDVFRTQAARPHPRIPAVTWGRDELHAGEMWNSNSLIAWLLARSGHRTGAIEMPPHGRAPGWSAGLVVAARQDIDTVPGSQRAGSQHAPDVAGPRKGEPSEHHPAGSGPFLTTPAP